MIVKLFYALHSTMRGHIDNVDGFYVKNMKGLMAV